MKTYFSLIIFVLVIICPNGLLAEFYFEETFNQYTKAWTPSGSSAISPCVTDQGNSCSANSEDIPAGWNGYSVDSGGGLSIVLNEGVENSPCLKVTYPKGNAQTKINLLKWLGAEGYNELYIKWRFKFKDSGDDRWAWGNGSQDSFGFLKLARIYQGVDLNNLRPRLNYSLTKIYSVHPSSYPNYIVPDWGNAGEYGDRPIIPIFYHTCVNNQFVGVSAPQSLWRNIYKYYVYGEGPRLSACLSPNDGVTNHICGPIYTPDEDPTRGGEFKNPQTWHSLTFHFKLRMLSKVDGTTLKADFVDINTLTVEGDETSIFKQNDLILCNDTGAVFDWGKNSPAMHKIEKSSYYNGKTTLRLYQQPSQEGPHLTDSITTIVKLKEDSPGIIESWIDNEPSINHTAPTEDKSFHNTNLGGGINYINFCDNLSMNRDHPITMYIDNIIISTAPILNEDGNGEEEEAPGSPKAKLQK